MTITMEIWGWTFFAKHLKSLLTSRRCRWCCGNHSSVTLYPDTSGSKPRRTWGLRTHTKWSGLVRDQRDRDQLERAAGVRAGRSAAL